MLIAFSLLIKHNLLALPAAIALWLFFHKRRESFLFIATVTGVIVISFSLFNVVYGPNFCDWIARSATHLLAHRWPLKYMAMARAADLADWPGRVCGGDPTGEMLKCSFLGLFAGFALCLGTAIAGGCGH